MQFRPSFWKITPSEQTLPCAVPVVTHCQSPPLTTVSVTYHYPGLPLSLVLSGYVTLHNLPPATHNDHSRSSRGIWDCLDGLGINDCETKTLVYVYMEAYAGGSSGWSSSWGCNVTFPLQGACAELSGNSAAAVQEDVAGIS